MITCRCPICGGKKAGSHGKAFGALIVPKDEHGFYFDAKNKNEARRLRRTREKQAWRKEIW